MAISYIIDVYREKFIPEKSLLKIALYITFFPHLIAGPIMRANELMPQFEKVHYINADRISNGILLILWGVYKKVVIADNLSLFVDNFYQPEFRNL